MKNIVVVLLLSTLGHPVFSQNQCALKFGSCYFINCKHIIVISGDDVFSLGKWENDAPEITFTIRAPDGHVLAQVYNGRLMPLSKEKFNVKHTTEEFIVVDDSTQRIVFMMKKVKPDKPDVSCQIDLYADLVMKNREVFQCTPKSCNLNVMQGLSGAVFKDGDTVFELY